MKYRSLKRRQVPEEKLTAGSSQHQNRMSHQTLLTVRSSEKTASGGIDNTRRALSTKRDVPSRIAEKLLSHRTSELEVLRRVSTEGQSSSRNTPERRTSAEADIIRRMPTERQARQRTTMERRVSEVYEPRRMLYDSQTLLKIPADHRASKFDFSRRMSMERRYSPRMSTDHIVYESDTTRKLSGERHSEGRMLSERRISEPHASRTSSMKRELSKRMLTDHVITKFNSSREVSTKRQSSRRLAGRLSEMQSGSRVSSKQSFSEIILAHSFTLNNPQDSSRKTTLTRVSSEQAKVSWHSTEHPGIQQRSNSNRMQTEERRVNAERSSSRQDKTGQSEGQHLKRSSAEKITDPERINAIQRTTRSMSSHISADRHDSRILPSFRMSSRRSTTGRLLEDRQNVRISHNRLLHAMPSVQRSSSLSSKQKENKGQSSKPVSRIFADQQNVRTSNSRLPSRISYDHIEAPVVSNKLLSKVSRTIVSPPTKSTDHIPASRLADNQRISENVNERTSSYRTAVNRRTYKEYHNLTLYRKRMSPLHLSQEHLASEERHKIRLNLERQPHLLESSGYYASFRMAKERRLSSGRLSPLDTTLRIQISEEQRNSRTSPTTHGLFTSGKLVSDSLSTRRLDQAVSRPSSELTASRRVSNERVLVQWSNLLSKQNAFRSGRTGHQFMKIQKYRNDHVTESPTQWSLGRSAEERASTPRDYRTTYAERLAALRGSERVSGERLAQERDSRSTERLGSLKHSRRVSAERLNSKRELESSAENLAYVRESRRTSAERIRSETDSRSSEGLAVVTNSRRISTVHLTPKRAYSRSAEHLASVRNSKRSASLRHSTTSVESSTIQRDFRSTERLTFLRDRRRTSTERLETQENFRKSSELLSSVKDSRKITPKKLATQWSTEQSQSSVSQIDSIRSSERVKTNRDSRITAERVTSIAASRRISTETLTHIRDSRKTSIIRGSRRVMEGSTSVTHHKIPPTLLETARNSRVSVEHLVSVRFSRRTSTEQLSTQRSLRYADRTETTLDMSRPSAERLVSERNSRHSVEGLISTRNSRISERWASDMGTRRPVKQLTSRKDSISITSERDFKHSVRLLALIRNFRISAERFTSYKESRHSLEHLPSERDSRKTADEKDSIPSVERLTLVRKSRISAEQMSERTSKHWVKHLASVRISKISAERLAYDRHLVDHLVSFRDFRKSSTERNFKQPDGHLAAMMDPRRIYAERLATERDFRQHFKGLASLKNAWRLPIEGLISVRNSMRTYVKQLRNSVGMVYKIQSAAKRPSDSLATRRLMTTAFTTFTRTILSDHHVSQLEPLPTIHITSKALKGHDVMMMSNVRNTELSDGHISKNQTLDQGPGLSEKQFITMDNTTLKTESSLDNGLLSGTVLKSVVNFSPTLYSSWSDSVTEYIRCALATLTVMWPSLAMWKAGVLKSLTGFDVAPAFSAEMAHLNSFFADKVHFTNFSYIILLCQLDKDKTLPTSKHNTLNI
jgi:hypothetical protein